MKFMLMMQGSQKGWESMSTWSQDDFKAHIGFMHDLNRKLRSLLLRLSDNPMVRLSHAIATAMVHGPEAGLRLVDRREADPRMAGTHRIDAVRGHLHDMAGDRALAQHHYRAAAALTRSLPERNYLLMKTAAPRTVARLTGES